jgi:hypothetical protein
MDVCLTRVRETSRKERENEREGSACSFSDGPARTEKMSRRVAVLNFFVGACAAARKNRRGPKKGAQRGALPSSPLATQRPARWRCLTRAAGEAYDQAGPSPLPRGVFPFFFPPARPPPPISLTFPLLSHPSSLTHFPTRSAWASTAEHVARTGDVRVGGTLVVSAPSVFFSSTRRTCGPKKTKQSTQHRRAEERKRRPPCRPQSTSATSSRRSTSSP